MRNPPPGVYQGTNVKSFRTKAELEQIKLAYDLEKIPYFVDTIAGVVFIAKPVKPTTVPAPGKPHSK